MKKGLTIIEILVVGAIATILFTVVVYVLFMSTRTAKKSQLESLVADQANWLIVELDKNLSRADISTISCNNTWISFEDRDYGNLTTITCTEGGQVASASANPVNLTNSEVRVSGCGSFISCNLPPTYPLPVINIEFTVIAGNSSSGKVEDYVERSFETTVVVRE